VAAPASRSVEAAWQAERAFHLTSVMERARATMSDRRYPESAKALAVLEALVAADAKRPTRPAKTINDIAALRAKVYRALNNLDAADSRFDDEMLLAWERDAIYRVVVRLLLS
jgi:hypothetical protein